MKWKYSVEVTLILMFVMHCVDALKLTTKGVSSSPVFESFSNDSKVVQINKFEISVFVSSTLKIILACLKEKTFFIITILFLRYSKSLVAISSLSATTIASYWSILLGQVNNLTSIWIDTIALILLTSLGLVYIVDALKKIESEKKELALEVNKQVMLEAGMEEGFKTKDEKVLLRKSNFFNSHSFKILLLTFTLILLAELDERTQISNMFITTNSHKFMILLAALVAQTVAMLFALVIAEILRNLLTEKFLGIVCGALLIYFGLISIYMACVHNYIFMHKTWDNISAINSYKS
jgi:putative Ca2+/H+ antiporter (TMEM165/GDT1 family)